MLALFVVALFERAPIVALGVFLNLFLSFLPAIVERNARKTLPWTLDFFVAFALLLHTAGIAFDLYHNPTWFFWDEITHFLGSIVIGMIAFHLVFTLNFLGKVVMSIPMMALFLFLSAMGIGGIWEILEFWSDAFLGTNTQLSLAETIRDLQFNALGALAISAISARYFLRKRR